MTHDDLVRHLSYHVDLALKDFGPVHGRTYLMGSIPVWREAYGEAMSTHMTALINGRLQKLNQRPML